MGGNNKKKSKNRNKKIKRQNAEKLNQFSEDRSQLDAEDNIVELDDKNELTTLDNSFKRQRAFDDSDHEDQPKKKKKKQPGAADTTDKKGKKSIRQMKREKFAQRQADAQAVAKDHLKGQCMNYLSQWKHDKQNWKFMKAKQVWLYKNKFSSNLLPDSSWPMFLEYFQSAQGNIRKMLLDDATKIIKQMDEWTETTTDKQTEEDDNEENIDESETTSTNKKPDENVYKRARDIIQCLEE